MATSTKDVCEVEEEIKQVRENHHILEEETGKITDRLRLERGRTSEERHRASVKNKSEEKKLVDARKELHKATEELRNLKELADEEISSLTSERDDSNEDIIAFELEYSSNKEKLRCVEEQLSKIHAEYRKLKEHHDEKSDQLVIERDNACDERYRARIRCDEIKKKIIEIEDKISKAGIEYNNLKEHTSTHTT